jgi:hypothetical protein
MRWIIMIEHGELQVVNKGQVVFPIAFKIVKVDAHFEGDKVHATCGPQKPDELEYIVELDQRRLRIIWNVEGTRTIRWRVQS